LMGYTRKFSSLALSRLLSVPNYPCSWPNSLTSELEEVVLWLNFSSSWKTFNNSSGVDATIYDDDDDANTFGCILLKWGRTQRYDPENSMTCPQRSWYPRLKMSFGSLISREGDIKARQGWCWVEESYVPNKNTIGFEDSETFSILRNWLRISSWGDCGGMQLPIAVIGKKMTNILQHSAVVFTWSQMFQILEDPPPKRS
jgi:hypothetical protein